jgi:excisionase family DNA binding protein
MDSVQPVQEDAMVQLLNVPETADRLRLSRRTVWQLIAEGQLRVVRIGNRVLVRPADLAEFVEERIDERPKEAA